MADEGRSGKVGVGDRNRLRACVDGVQKMQIQRVDHRHRAIALVGDKGGLAVGTEGQVVRSVAQGQRAQQATLAGIDHRDRSYIEVLGAVGVLGAAEQHPGRPARHMPAHATRPASERQPRGHRPAACVDHHRFVVLRHGDQKPLAVGGQDPVFASPSQLDQGQELTAAKAKERIDHREGAVVVEGHHVVDVEIQLGAREEAAAHEELDPLAASARGGRRGALAGGHPGCRIGAAVGLAAAGEGETETHLNVLAHGEASPPRRGVLLRRHSIQKQIDVDSFALEALPGLARQHERGRRLHQGKWRTRRQRARHGPSFLGSRFDPGAATQSHQGEGQGGGQEGWLPAPNDGYVHWPGPPFASSPGA